MPLENERAAGEPRWITSGDPRCHPVGDSRGIPRASVAMRSSNGADIIGTTPEVGSVTYGVTRAINSGGLGVV